MKIINGKMVWAPIALPDGKLYRVRCKYSMYDDTGAPPINERHTFFVTPCISKPRKFTLTFASGKRIAREFNSTAQACRYYKDNVNLQTVPPILLRGGLTQDEIKKLPLYKPTPDDTAEKSKAEKKYSEAVKLIKQEAPAWCFVAIEKYLPKVFKDGYLRRTPPKKIEYKAVWGALQPNYHKINGSVVGAMLFVDKDLKNALHEILPIKWPVSFDKDAEELTRMGAF